jgi:hypothetical protein
MPGRCFQDNVTSYAGGSANRTLPVGVSAPGADVAELVARVDGVWGATAGARLEHLEHEFALIEGRP